jgi:hypothetical protein
MGGAHLILTPTGPVTYSRDSLPKLRALLRESKREHYESETDSMDNCPMRFSVKDCKVMCMRRECTCGADAWNARVDKALEAL